nr:MULTISPECIES: hypothetical protein [unclassified Halomonas]
MWGHDEHFEVEAEKEEAKAARDAAQPSRQKTEEARRQAETNLAARLFSYLELAAAI